jgi:hypothetical protein
MTSIPLSLTTASLFGLGVWLILPQSIKCIAELFQLLLLCHLCFIAGRVSGLEWIIGNHEQLVEELLDWLIGNYEKMI